MAVVVVVKRQRLLPVGGIVCVIKIECDASRGATVTGDELENQGTGHAVNIPAI